MAVLCYNYYPMITPNLPANIDLLQWAGPDDPAYIASGLVHCSRIPEEASRAQPAPAVVMVHGWGGDESVMWIFKQAIPAGVAIITPRAPFELDQGGYSWFIKTQNQRRQPAQESVQQAVQTFEQFVEALPRLYPIDPARLVLIGFSQGAALITAYTLTNPERVSRVAVLAGAMTLNVPEVDLHFALLAGLPVFMAHGLDDDTVPVDEARQTRDTYLAAGADVTYNEYKTGHKVNSQGMRDLKDWLAKVVGNR